MFEQVVRELQTGNYNGINQVEDLIQAKLELESDQARELAQLVIEKVNKNNFPAITDLELLLTSDCVLRCDYCFGEMGEQREIEQMSWDTAKGAVDFLMEYSGSAEEVSILFFGGEPLMEFDLLCQVVRYAREEGEKRDKKVHLNLTTNGVLLNEEKLDFFREHRVRFLVSMDGNQVAHDRHRKFPSGEGSYREIAGRLPLFKKYQPWLGVRMTISPDIVHLVGESFLELIEEGVNQFLISPIDGIVWSQEELDGFYEQLRICHEIYQEKKKAGYQIRVSNFESYEKGDFFNREFKWGCRAGRQTISVDAAGEIYPCSKMLSPQGLRDACRLGSLETGIESLGLRMRFCAYVSDHWAECRQCSLKTSCTGGCYANNYWATGNLFVASKDEVCRQVRANVGFYGREFG